MMQIESCLKAEDRVMWSTYVAMASGGDEGGLSFWSWCGKGMRKWAGGQQAVPPLHFFLFALPKFPPRQFHIVLLFHDRQGRVRLLWIQWHYGSFLSSLIIVFHWSFPRVSDEYQACRLHLASLVCSPSRPSPFFFFCSSVHFLVQQKELCSYVVSAFMFMCRTCIRRLEEAPTILGRSSCLPRLLTRGFILKKKKVIGKRTQRPSHRVWSRTDGSCKGG